MTTGKGELQALILENISSDENNMYKSLAIAAMTAVLTACGGGGSDDTALPDGFDCRRQDITSEQKAECDRLFPAGTTGGVSNGAVTNALGNTNNSIQKNN